MSTRLMLFSLVSGLVGIFYGITLAPGVVGGDAGEHQFAAPLLGIPHATGYPLYILLGKLWTTLLPVGSLAWRMNLFSAVNGALAAGVTSLVVYELSQPKSWAGAVVAGLTLSWGLTMWQWSIIAGVRSLNVLFFALLTLQMIVWQSQLQYPDKAARTLRLLALTVGLSLAHHRTTLFYLPSLVMWVLWHDRTLWRDPKRLISLFALSLAPLSLYAFIYFRGINHPPYSHETITDWSSFWFLVGASDSSGLFRQVDLAYLPDRLAFMGRDLLAQLSWPGVLMAMGGLGVLARHQPKQALAQLLLILLLSLFVLQFAVVNLNEAPTWYLMPAYFLCNVWLGIGLNAVKLPKFTPLWPLAYACLLSYTLAYPNAQRLYHEATQPLDEWRQLLRGYQAQRFVTNSLPYVEPNSLLLGDWEQYTPMMYNQLIHQIRPDVTPRLPLDNWPRQVEQARQQGQPVYFMRKTSDLLGTPYLSMVGPLIHLQTAPNFHPPATMTPVAAHFEHQLELLGYQTTLWPAQRVIGQVAPPMLQVMLYWRVPQPVSWDYAFSFRIVDAQGQTLSQRDATHPVLSSYPTTLWQAGEVVGDFYEFTLPPEAMSLIIMPYRTEGAGQWHNLVLNETGQAGFTLQVR